MKRLKKWIRARYAAVALRIEKWIRVHFYTSVLRSSAERVAGGLCTAAMIGMLVDPQSSGWATVALSIAGGLLYVAARRPKGGKQ